MEEKVNELEKRLKEYLTESEIEFEDFDFLMNALNKRLKNTIDFTEDEKKDFLYFYDALIELVDNLSKSLKASDSKITDFMKYHKRFDILYLISRSNFNDRYPHNLYGISFHDIVFRVGRFIESAIEDIDNGEYIENVSENLYRDQLKELDMFSNILCNHIKLLRRINVKRVSKIWGNIADVKLDLDNSKMDKELQILSILKFIEAYTAFASNLLEQESGALDLKFKEKKDFKAYVTEMSVTLDEYAEAKVELQKLRSKSTQ
jgi:hypothetical protein